MFFNNLGGNCNNPCNPTPNPCNQSTSWWPSLETIRGSLCRLVTMFTNFFYQGDATYRNIDLGIAGVLVSSVTTRLTDYYIYNNAVTPSYVKIYDLNSVPTVANIPWRTLAIPAQSAANLAGWNQKLLNGFSIRASAGIADNDNTALPANTVSVNIGFQVNVA